MRFKPLGYIVPLTASPCVHNQYGRVLFCGHIANDVLASLSTHGDRILKPGEAGEGICTLRIGYNAPNTVPFGLLQDFPGDRYGRSWKLIFGEQSRSARWYL